MFCPKCGARMPAIGEAGELQKLKCSACGVTVAVKSKGEAAASPAGTKSPVPPPPPEFKLAPPPAPPPQTTSVQPPPPPKTPKRKTAKSSESSSSKMLVITAVSAAALAVVGGAAFLLFGPKKKVDLQAMAWSHLPTSWQAVGRLKTTEYLKSRLGKELKDLVAAQKFPSAGPFESADEVVFAYYPGGKSVRVGVFPPGVLDEQFGSSRSVDDYRGVPLFRDPQGLYARPNSCVLVASNDPAMLREAVSAGAIGHPLEVSLPADSQLAMQFRKLEGGDLDLARKSASSFGKDLPPIEAIRLTANVGNDIDVNAVVDARDQPSAKTLAEKMKAGVAEAKNILDTRPISAAPDGKVALFTLAKAAVEATIVAEGNAVNVAAKIPGDALAKIFRNPIVFFASPLMVPTPPLPSAQNPSPNAGKQIPSVAGDPTKKPAPGVAAAGGTPKTKKERPKREPPPPGFRRPAAPEVAKRNLTKMPESKIKITLNYLRKKDFFSRRDAATTLAQCEPFASMRKTVLRELKPLIEDQYPQVRVAAVKALANWADDSVTDVFLKLLDGDASLKLFVFEALSTVKEERVAEALEGEVLRGNVAVAPLALQRLGSVAEPSAIRLLSAKERTVRRMACKILQVVGTPAAIPALEAANEADSVLEAEVDYTIKCCKVQGAE